MAGDSESMRTVIEPFTIDDWDEIREIYQEGIATGHATFEIIAPAWNSWDSGHLRQGRLVARDPQRIVGWTALSPVSARQVYAGVAELSIYVAAASRARGIGKELMRALIESSERAGIWTLQGSVFPENAASRALLKWCGFREVGYRERIGQRNGVWRDTILMERRSPAVGG